MLKTFSAVFVFLVFAFVLPYNMRPVQAAEAIYIRADGSIDPSTVAIARSGETYTFTDNVLGWILIQKDSIVLDGAGFTLQGTSSISLGLEISYRNNVTIQDLNIDGFLNGVTLWLSSNCTINRNNITNNEQDGLCIDHSSDNHVYGNRLAGNGGLGLWLCWCNDNVLKNNTMEGNGRNFGVYGESLEEFCNDVDFSNIVDGKRVCYWVGRNGGVVPYDAGFVALVNCTHIRVVGLELKNNDEGVWLVYTSDSFVSRCHIFSNQNGVWIYCSSRNQVASNWLRSNGYGISIWSSSDNSIYQNIIENNYYGIDIYKGYGNVIYHNNIIVNYHQVDILQGWSSSEQWDLGFVDGGNYWSNYNGKDEFSGWEQNVPGRDGLGDSPVVMDVFNRDNYPLMRPFPALVGDVNCDGVVDIFDAIKVACAWGSKFGDLNYIREADLYCDWVINVYDAMILAACFGEYL